MLQQFFEMKTFTPLSSKYTLSSLRHLKLGTIKTRHNHLLSIIWNFYYEQRNCFHQMVVSKWQAKLKWFASGLSERVTL